MHIEVFLQPSVGTASSFAISGFTGNTEDWFKLSPCLGNFYLRLMVWNLCRIRSTVPCTEVVLISERPLSEVLLYLSKM